MINEPDAINAPHPTPLPGGEGTSDANFRLFATASDSGEKNDPVRNRSPNGVVSCRWREKQLQHRDSDNARCPIASYL